MLKEPGENTIDFLIRALNPFSFRNDSKVGDAALTITSWAAVGVLAGAADAARRKMIKKRDFGGSTDTSVVDVDFDPARATHSVDKFASEDGRLLPPVLGVPVDDTLAFRMMGAVTIATVAALAGAAAYSRTRSKVAINLSDAKGDRLDRDVTRTIVEARENSIDKDAQTEDIDEEIRQALAGDGTYERDHGIFAKSVANLAVLAVAAGLAAFGAGALHGHSFVKSKDKNAMKLEQLKALRDRQLGDLDTPVRVNLMGLNAPTREGGGEDPAAPSVALYEKN